MSAVSETGDISYSVFIDQEIVFLLSFNPSYTVLLIIL